MTSRAPARLPRGFSGLVRLMPPRAIESDARHARVLGIVDRLMAIPRLTRDQKAYLETLVQLVQAYEAAHHPIDTAGISPLDSLKHLLSENGMNASDLARLLGVHVSLGSKILKGERSLTLDHVKTLCARFAVGPALFIG